MDFLTILRIIIGISFLSYASYSDIKTRTVSDKVWLLIGVFGFLFLLYEFYNNPYYILALVSFGIFFLTAFFEATEKTDFYKGEINKFIFYPILIFGFALFFFVFYKFAILSKDWQFIKLLLIPLMILICYGLYYSRLLHGGADAKALMSISVLTPFYPTSAILTLIFPSFVLWSFSINNEPIELYPFAIVVLTNSVIFAIFIPLIFFFYNLANREVKFPQCFFGYKMDLEKAKKKFVWLLETVENDKVVQRVFVERGEDKEKQIAELERLGIKRAWITPKIPFIIPMLAGFILAFVFGDIMFKILSLILGR